METIKKYLDNFFSQLPDNTENKRIKSEIYNEMELQYNYIMSQGKNENEAIGTVLSSFADLNEIVDEKRSSIMDEKPFENNKGKSKESEVHVLQLSDAHFYIDSVKKSSFLIALGTALCILSGASVIFFSIFFDNELCVVPLFLLIAVAVGLFIYANMLMDDFRYIEHGNFTISPETKDALLHERESYKNDYAIKNISAVILCIISPIFIFIGSAINMRYSDEIGVCCLLIVIAAAVFVLILENSFYNSYNKLINKKFNPYYSKDLPNCNNKFIRAILSVYWPVVVILYLIISFTFMNWYISWIIFLIAAIPVKFIKTMYGIK